MRDNIQRIKVIEHKELRRLIEVKDAFEFRPERGHVLLQKICFWFLRKMGAYRVGESITVKTIQIDSDKFIDQLLRQRKSLFKFFNLDASRLLIGPDDFHSLMGEMQEHYLFSFNAEYYRNGELFGIKVYVIPWMKGMLVLPNNLNNYGASR